MIGSDEGRFDNDHSLKHSESERDAAAAKAEAIDDVKDIFLLAVAEAARKYGQAIDAIDPKLVARHSRTTHQTERGAEGVQGLVEDIQAAVSDMASDFVDAEELEKLRSIAETGYAY
mgnify:CR=1 FL=1